MALEFFNSAINRKIPTGEVKKKHEITTINTLYFYSIGGFGLPFWLVGGIALVASVLIFIFVPNVEASQDESSKESKSLGLLSIAKVFSNVLHDFL